MATKFRQKSAKITDFSCLQEIKNFSVNLLTLKVKTLLFYTFRVSELKYAIQIFNGTKGVAMTAKFRRNYAKIAHILVLYKVWRHFCMYDKIFGVGEFKYAIRIFQGANGFAMGTKCR